jgi:hypothetical protein
MKLAMPSSNSPRSFAALLALSLGVGLCASCSSDTAEPSAGMTTGGNTGVGGSTGGGGSGGTASGGGGAGGMSGGTANGGGGTGGIAAGGGGTGGVAAGGGGTGGVAAGGGGAGGVAAGGGGAGGGGAGGGGAGGGGAGGQANVSADCMEFCQGDHSIVVWCADMNYYADEAACLTDCAANSEAPWNMECRLMHLGVAPATGMPDHELHCGHVNGDAPCADM